MFIRRIFFGSFIFVVLYLWCFEVCASTLVAARIGNQFYDTLEEAIEAASSSDIISLTKDISLDESLEIKKNVNINLNNHKITAPEKVFIVQGGSLNLSGTGTISETKPNYGAIIIKGSENSKDVNYSTISVSSGITLEGWSGIFIDHNNKNSYGVLVNMNGNINAVDDTSGGNGAGVYVNGNIKHQENSPIINLSDTVKITSTGNGIYSAGYATYNINGSNISGTESGLGIKSGVFNIKNATITSSGLDKTPTSGNNNGINASGAAIQIESNSNYAGNVELNIQSGLIQSQNSNAIYEYTVNSSPTSVKSISLSGGKYLANSSKEVFSFSNDFKNKHTSFISGGVYSTSPSSYLMSGYNLTKNVDSLYEVISSTMSVFKEESEVKSNNWFLILSIITMIILGIVSYFKRNVILNFVRKIRNRV